MCRWNTHLGRQDRSHHQHEVGNNLWPSPGQDFAHLSAQNANTKRFIFACFRASPSPKSKSKPKLSSLLYFLFSDLRLPLFADKILGCRGGGAGRQQKGSAPVRSLSPFSVPRQKRIWKGGGWRKKGFRLRQCSLLPSDRDETQTQIRELWAGLVGKSFEEQDIGKNLCTVPQRNE